MLCNLQQGNQLACRHSSVPVGTAAAGPLACILEMHLAPPHFWLSCSAAAVVEAEQKLQTPHGNKLVDLMLPESEQEAAKAACTKSMELSDRNACDVELLCVGCAWHLQSSCCASNLTSWLPLSGYVMCTRCVRTALAQLVFCFVPNSLPAHMWLLWNSAGRRDTDWPMSLSVCAGVSRRSRAS